MSAFGGFRTLTFRPKLGVEAEWQLSILLGTKADVDFSIGDWQLPTQSLTTLQTF